MFADRQGRHAAKCLLCYADKRIGLCSKADGK